VASMPVRRGMANLLKSGAILLEDNMEDGKSGLFVSSSGLHLYTTLERY
jgi:hypothetical protein